MNNRVVFDSSGVAKCDAGSSRAQTQAGRFRDQPLISGPPDAVITALASNLLEAAKTAVKSNGVFHLALSGGSSPELLFHELAYFTQGFPWQQTHIWQVDERSAFELTLSSRVSILQNDAHKAFHV